MEIRVDRIILPTLVHQHIKAIKTILTEILHRCFIFEIHVSNKRQLWLNVCTSITLPSWFATSWSGTSWMQHKFIWTAFPFHPAPVPNDLMHNMWCIALVDWKWTDLVGEDCQQVPCLFLTSYISYSGQGVDKISRELKSSPTVLPLRAPD